MSTKNPNMTKAERRDAARAEALALREKELKRDKRNRVITLSVLAVALVALAVVVWVILAEGQKKDVDDVPLSEVTMPAGATDSGGIPVGKDGAAGTSNEGAPEIDVYLDYMCPICGQFEQVNADGIEKMVAAGDATIVYHPIAMLDNASQGTEYSTRSAAAAAWVADQAPDAFPAFHDALFQNQPEENSPGLTNDELASYAKQAGAPADVSSAISDGSAREKFGQYAHSAFVTVQQNKDFSGTPFVLIDDKVIGPDTWSQPGGLQDAVKTAAGS